MVEFAYTHSAMKMKLTLFIVGVLLGVTALAAKHDCQILSNGIGDSYLVSSGGFSFARPYSIDFFQMNAPLADVPYSVRCRILFKDHKLGRLMTCDDKDAIRKIGDLLNEWLDEFMFVEYAGIEYADLRRMYLSRDFVQEVNRFFPEYVDYKISDMDSDARIDVEIIIVEIEAIGAFYEDLIAYKNGSLRECDLLNTWLMEFMIAEYVGVEYVDLCRAHSTEDFSDELKDLFLGYVFDTISGMDSDECLDIETMFEMVDSFCEDFIEYMGEFSLDAEP